VVHDLAGNLIRTPVSGSLPARSGQVCWNRTDDEGRTVARGVYFCRLQANGTGISRKLVMR